MEANLAKTMCLLFDNGKLCYEPPLSQLSNAFLFGNFLNPLKQARYSHSAQSFRGGDEQVKHLPNDLPNREILLQKVWETIRTRPRWEKRLLSDFPSLNFSDPDLVYNILKRESNPLISFRFLRWASSQKGCSLDARCINFILNSLINAKAWPIAMTVLRSMKCQVDPTLLESFISGLCMDSRISESLEILSLSKELNLNPTIPMWNAILLGALSIGKTDLVSQLYGEMVGTGMMGDESTVGYLIQAFCMQNKVSEAHGLLRESLANGYVPDAITFSRLISGFSHSRDYDRVSELLHLMIAKNRKPNIFTYQEIIHGLCINKRVLEAFQVFNDIKARGYAPDAVTYTTMIHGLCKFGSMIDAQNLWQEMRLKKLESCDYIYNIFICAYCRIGNLQEAWNLFLEMSFRGYRCTRSYSALMTGLCEWGRSKEAKHLFGDMLKRSISPDLTMYNHLIKRLSAQGEIKEAVNVYSDITAAGFQPSHSSCVPLIRQFARLDEVEKVMEFMEEMWKHGMVPPARSFDYVISRLCLRRNATEGMNYLARAMKDGVRTRKRTFTKLIECLCLQGRLNDALLVLDVRFELNYMLGKSLWSLLISELCKNIDQTRECLDGILQVYSIPAKELSTEIFNSSS